MRKPQKASIALKQDILVAAERLFKEFGYDNTTLQMIADELNIVQGSVTYHFQNKHRIAHDIFERFRNLLHEYIRENMEDGFNYYYYYCIFFIYAYGEIMKRESNWKLFYHKDVIGVWKKEKMPLIEKMYQLIMDDFRKSFTEEELHAIAVMDWGSRMHLFQEYTESGESMDIGKYCYYNVYLIGLLARLDEATIQKNIHGAFEFTDSHDSPTVYLLQ